MGRHGGIDFQRVRSRARSLRRAVASAVLSGWRVAGITAVLGCTAAHEQGSSTGATGGTFADKSGGSAPSGATGAVDCIAAVGDPPVTAGRVRRLSHLELENTLSDLLGEESGALAKSVEADASVTKYSTGADRTVSSNYVSDLGRVAKLAANNLVQASESGALGADCLFDEVSATACATAFIQRFGAHAWRRPLTQTELEELLVVYEAGRRTAGERDSASALRAGLDYVVRALLQASSFIFRTELGPADSREASVALTPFEAAAALAYGLIGSAPDAELTSQAESGALATMEALTQQGRRLLQAHPERFARQAEVFVREWLGIDLASPTWKKDAALFPQVTDEFRTALELGTSLFLRDWARGSSFSELMTTPRSFVSKRTAWLYGVAGDSSYFVDGAPEFAAIVLDPRQRAGVLTLPSFLGSLAHETASSPVLRGVTVMRKFLCLQPPPVPAVIPPLPPADPGNPQTTRARYAQHTTVAFCADCHSTFDPMGNTFEHYDAVGGYRELENGLTVDSTGALIDGAGSITSVTDAVELAALLSTKAEVHACFVRQVYRFVSGQNESDADACALSTWTQRFDEHDANVAELMLDLVTTLASQPRLASIPEP